MPVERIEHSDLDNTLRITITKDQYLDDWKNELKKTRNKAQFKGFRKGKTPIGFVKKMYGQSILGEAVNQKVQSELSNYIHENKLSILGQPIPSDDQALINFDIHDLADYTFNFDVGLAPDFDLVSLENLTFDKDKVEITEEAIDEELLNAQKRLGEQVTVEAVEDGDIITVLATELDDEGQTKEGGHSHSFPLAVNLLSEKLQNELLGKGMDWTFESNIFELEKEAQRDKVIKHFLGLEKEDEMMNEIFRLTITEIKRQELAELNADFFGKLFSSEEITELDQAREKIKEELEKYFDQQAERLMLHKVREELVDKQNLILPDEFLKRWLTLSNQDGQIDDLDHEYGHLAEELKWSLIQGKVMEFENLEVTPTDMKEAFEKRILSYFGGSIPKQNLDEMVKRTMENSKQVEQQYETLKSEKVFAGIMAKIQTNSTSISLDQFKEKVLAFNEVRQHNH